MRDYSIYYAKEQGRRLPCFCFDSVSSTNDVAKTLLHRGKCGEDAFAVLAAEQCSGRGRMGRTFVSPRGKGIYMTLVRKAAGVADVSPAGCFSALAVCDLLGQVFGLDCTLKWPNDVLAGGKKICGILPESVVAANGERYVLIGTGINVLTDETDLGDLQEIATSVLLETEKGSINLSFCGNTAKAIRRLGGVLALGTDEIVRRFLAGDEDLAGEYSERLSTIGKEVGFSGEDGAALTGKAVGVTSDAALQVYVNGVMHTVRWGEVTSQPEVRRN